MRAVRKPSGHLPARVREAGRPLSKGEAGSESRRPIRAAIGGFLHTEAAGGAVLLAATAAALLWANLPTSAYASFWERSITLGVGRLTTTMSLAHWINDGLMTFFFFLVGLEIKRELVAGELSERRSALLPVIAALGGVAMPAVIYFAITAGTPYARGWAIPMATDIAFVAGVMAIASRGIPPGMRVFMLALAIVDDIVAIVVIAAFYGGSISYFWLAAAGVAIAATALLRRSGIRHEALFLISLALSWALLLGSGVHATLAGVAVAMLVPAGSIDGRNILASLERALHPVVSFGIVPLFALANAGVAINAATLRFAAGASVTWGVIAGLVVGKPLGITLGAAAAVRARVGELPAGVTWLQLGAASVLGGIGFTVSLILAGLTFDSEVVLDATKLAVLSASVVAALAAGGLLALTGRAEGETTVSSP